MTAEVLMKVLTKNSLPKIAMALTALCAFGRAYAGEEAAKIAALERKAARGENPREEKMP